MIEALSYKLGLVLLVVGFMPFFNLAVLSRMRMSALGRNGASRTVNQNVPQTQSR